MSKNKLNCTKLVWNDNAEDEGSDLNDSEDSTYKINNNKNCWIKSIQNNKLKLNHNRSFNKIKLKKKLEEINKFVNEEKEEEKYESSFEETSSSEEIEQPDKYEERFCSVSSSDEERYERADSGGGGDDGDSGVGGYDGVDCDGDGDGDGGGGDGDGDGTVSDNYCHSFENEIIDQEEESDIDDFEIKNETTDMEGPIVKNDLDNAEDNTKISEEESEEESENIKEKEELEESLKEINEDDINLDDIFQHMSVVDNNQDITNIDNIDNIDNTENTDDIHYIDDDEIDQEKKEILQKQINILRENILTLREQLAEAKQALEREKKTIVLPGHACTIGEPCSVAAQLEERLRARREAAAASYREGLQQVEKMVSQEISRLEADMMKLQPLNKLAADWDVPYDPKHRSIMYRHDYMLVTSEMNLNIPNELKSFMNNDFIEI